MAKNTNMRLKYVMDRTTVGNVCNFNVRCFCFIFLLMFASYTFTRIYYTYTYTYNVYFALTFDREREGERERARTSEREYHSNGIKMVIIWKIVNEEECKRKSSEEK